jgi:hypothetical protein
MRWQRRIRWGRGVDIAKKRHVVMRSLGTRGGSKTASKGAKKGEVDVQDMSVETYLINGVLRASVEGKAVGDGLKDGQLLCNNGPPSLASLQACGSSRIGRSS